MLKTVLIFHGIKMAKKQMSGSYQQSTITMNLKILIFMMLKINQTKCARPLNRIQVLMILILMADNHLPSQAMPMRPGTTTTIPFYLTIQLQVNPVPKILPISLHTLLPNNLIFIQTLLMFLQCPAPSTWIQLCNITLSILKIECRLYGKLHFGFIPDAKIIALKLITSFFGILFFK